MIGIDADTVLVGCGVPFDRIRRITDYMVGTIDRFNNAKRAEVRDRVKHVKFSNEGWEGEMQ